MDCLAYNLQVLLALRSLADRTIGRAFGTIMEFGEAIKNPAYRIFQTEYSGCLDISAHA